MEVTLNQPPLGHQEAVNLATWRDPVPEGALCAHCSLRAADRWWWGTYNFMEVNHGAPVEPTCEICMLERQLDWSRDEIAKLELRIPDLIARLIHLRVGNP